MGRFVGQEGCYKSKSADNVACRSFGIARHDAKAEVFGKFLRQGGYDKSINYDNAQRIVGKWAVRVYSDGTMEILVPLLLT